MCGQACRDLNSPSAATTRSCGSLLEDEVALAGRSRDSRALLLSLQSAGLDRRQDLQGGCGSDCLQPAGDETPPHLRRLWTEELPRYKDAFLMRSGRPPRMLMISESQSDNKGPSIVGDHMELVLDNGGVPVIIPRSTRTVSHLSEYLPMDGLIIADGKELSFEMLQKYGCHVPGSTVEEGSKEPTPDGEFDTSKDELDFALLRLALAAKCPILALGRGSLMLNAMRGGTLTGDIGAEEGKNPHEQGRHGSPDNVQHSISVEPATPMSEWFSESLGATGKLLVNADHHIGVERLGEDLVEMARGPAGSLEAFYDPSYDVDNGRFVVGLQFHPGGMLGDCPGFSQVYKAFMEASWSYKSLQDYSA
mmetsp:Transcript_53554/g.115722  ORF Transcript_53554/g.115722 Transcript_53554/m.115722 type:complete len:364 (+) Transcript_53554:1-1092(+)